MGRHGRMAMNGMWLLGIGLAAISATETAGQVGCFGTWSSAFDVGHRPCSVVVGDVDGDGAKDLAVANHESHDVSILVNAGNGTCEQHVRYATQNFPLSVALGDVDGDGMLDLAVAGGNLSLLLNRGDGTFGEAIWHSTGFAESVAMGDLNGDGALDIAVVGPWEIGILLNDGDGTFGDVVSYANESVATESIALGDVNGDGALDLAVANHGSPWIGGAGEVRILLNAGDGTLGDGIAYAVGLSPSCVVLGDVNGDGVIDLVVANADRDDASVFLNTGNGAFGEEVRYATGETPRSLSLGDVDGDGALDLVVANRGYAWSSGDVSVLLNSGDGTFQEQARYPAGEKPDCVAVGDMNSDAMVDLVVVDGESDNVSLLMNDCPSVCAADLDGSGDVGFADLTPLLGVWGACAGSCPEDLDGDHNVGFADLTMLLGAWGPC